MRDDPLEPDPDVLFYLDLEDEVLQFYLSQARASGMVFSLVVKQLLSKLYRDHDFIKRREIEGKPPMWTDMLRRDLQAIAWLIRAAMQYVPDEVQRHPIPPQPPRPRKTQKQSRAALKARKDAAHQKDIRYQQEQ